MATNEPAIFTRNLVKRFNGRPALDGLNLKVERGGVFALLGPNGAGKTTTLRLLLNLLQPTSGQMQVLGLDAVADSVEVRGRVGYQPETQRFNRLLRVEEIVGTPHLAHPSGRLGALLPLLLHGTAAFGEDGHLIRPHL